MNTVINPCSECKENPDLCQPDIFNDFWNIQCACGNEGDCREKHKEAIDVWNEANPIKETKNDR